MAPSCRRRRAPLASTPSSAGCACACACAATVHVGGGNHVDLAQVACVRGVASVRVVEHDTFHHNVPQFLQQAGELVPLLRDEVMRVLRAAEAAELHTAAASSA